MTDEPFIQGLTEALASIVGQIIPDCAGTCLGTSALLARALADNDIATDAVRGTYQGEAHWWLEADGLLIDATRGQFDDGPMVYWWAEDDSTYVAEQRWPAGWTYEQAVAEFARMCVYSDVGENHGRQISAELHDLAAGLRRPAALLTGSA